MKSINRFALCVFSSGALLLPLLVAGAGPAQQPTAAASAAPAKVDLPAGDGKDLLVKNCSGCHQLTVVTAQHKNESGWTDTIVEMRNRGATGSDEDMEKIIHYLTTNFGTEPAPVVPDATPGTAAPKTDAKSPTNF